MGFGVEGLGFRVVGEKGSGLKDMTRSQKAPDPFRGPPQSLIINVQDTDAGIHGPVWAVGVRRNPTGLPVCSANIGPNIEDVKIRFKWCRD